MIKNLSSNDLNELSKKIRCDILRMICEAGSGHPGGSLSAIDILLVLYFNVMNHDPKNPEWVDRDRFILSKGHAAPALYTVLAECGYFSKNHLLTLRKIGTILQGHPDKRVTPGIEVSSGSLGNGLSISAGLALAAKIDKKKHHIFCLLGDGECDEGTVWEGAMLAPHYKLNNLTAIIDRNGLQIDGRTETVMRLEPLADKWKAFNWNVIKVDGHNYDALYNAFEESRNEKDKPSVIIASTIKGRGVSFMEGVKEFHGKPPNKLELEQALKELEA
ncbi:transketolase [Candidatus Bathyarchaeota archaeon]|nr:transketolase [Candidatus Bathyarchaeota archaeon]